jgi:hypothetical protein
MKMEINNWKGIENYYNEILRDGYAFQKGTEHLHHAEKDETKKEIIWDMNLKKWSEEGWSISQQVKCENITLVKGALTRQYVMNNWCGCVDEETAK